MHWTREEHSLLLRAWLDVAEAIDSNDLPPSKALVNERVFERFLARTSGEIKRKSSATALQKAVLVFNYNFVLHYNREHSANAWVSLDPKERADVFAREKTAAYNYIDLDESMVQTLKRIRKRLPSDFRASSMASTSTSRRRVGEKRKAGDGDNTDTACAISFQKVIDEHRSASTSDGDSSDAVDSHAAKPKARRLATANAKRTQRATSTTTSELEALVAGYRKTSKRLDELTRRLEHVLAVDRGQAERKGRAQSI